MRKCKKWIGFITIVLCAFILNSSEGEVFAKSSCTQKKAQDYYQVSGSVDHKNNIIKITAKHGSFSVSLSGTQDGEYQLVAGTPLEIPYKTDKDAYIEAKAKLLQGDEVCDVDDKNSVTFELEFDVGLANQKEENIYYDNLCATFRNEAASKGATSFMQQALSYCYQRQVDANFTKTNVETMIRNANSAWALKEEAMKADQGDLTISTGFKRVGSTNIKSTLKCDPWSKEKNVNKYAYTKTVINNEVCKVVCKEELTVIYDPPVSVKAGLCFTYTVEVKSKVTCKSTITGTAPSMPSICMPYPVCNQQAGYTDQAGPNEDFDQCILDCDGGKYGQSCINKCYNKVYGTNNRKMLSYVEDVKATQVFNDCKSAKDCSGSNYVDVYNDIQANGEGEYYWDGDTIRWRSGPGYWERFGRYYFHSLEKAGRTVVNHQGKSWNGYPPRVYQPDSEGFKRSGTCKQHCYWTGCSKGDALNPKDAMEEYKKEMAEYEQMLRECTSFNKCQEKTAYFTMSVLPSNGDNWVEYTATNRPKKSGSAAPSGDSIINDHTGVCYGRTDAEGNDYRTVINFPGVWINNKNGQVITKRPPKNDEVFYKHKPNEYCTPLNSKNVNEKWWAWDQGVSNYTAAEKSTIERNLKYNIKATIENFGRFSWDLKINCFYAIYNGTFDDDDPSPTPDPNGPTPEGGNGGEEAITPTCADGSCRVNPKCDIDSKDCVTTDITSYRYKAAALDDLFVGDDATTNAQETGRATGWNWSCAATDLTDDNYPVAPTALITDIQSKSDSIYKDDSKYLDYSITLTPATIKKIKSTNQSQKNFLNYTGTRDKAHDITKKRSTYRSKLLDQLGRDVVTTRYTSAIGCNNQEAGHCVTVDMIQSDQCIASYKNLMK